MFLLFYNYKFSYAFLFRYFVNCYNNDLGSFVCFGLYYFTYPFLDIGLKKLYESYTAFTPFIFFKDCTYTTLDCIGGENCLLRKLLTSIDESFL